MIKNTRSNGPTASFGKLRNTIIIVSIIALVFIVVLAFFIVKPNQESLPKYALAQFLFSAGAFVGIVLSLFYTVTQLKKAMDKPQIKVAFNEKGEQQVVLTYQNGRASALPALWLINEGNVISRYFQIDFIIPENIGKQSVYVNIAKDNKNYVISNINDGRYTLFVNRPYQDPNMIISGIDYRKCIEGNYIIKYRVYGDWAETQEGKLKIICTKQQE